METAMEGYHVLDHPWEEREGYVLLGRIEGNVPGYLSYSAEEGEVVCVFENSIEAEQFYMHWRARIPGEGWGTVRPGTEELISLLRNFDFVSVNPQPVPGSTERLYSVEDFVRTLRELPGQSPA
jgi:hypothetical protein